MLAARSISGLAFVGEQMGDPVQGRPRHRRRRGDRQISRWLRQRSHPNTALPELRGKNLSCRCHAKRCSAEVLLELANAV